MRADRRCCAKAHVEEKVEAHLMLSQTITRMPPTTRSLQMAPAKVAVAKYASAAATAMGATATEYMGSFMHIFHSCALLGSCRARHAATHARASAVSALLPFGPPEVAAVEALCTLQRRRRHASCLCCGRDTHELVGACVRRVQPSTRLVPAILKMAALTVRSTDPGYDVTSGLCVRGSQRLSAQTGYIIHE